MENIRVGERMVLAGNHKILRSDITWGIGSSLLSKFENKDTILNLIFNIGESKEVDDLLSIYINTTDNFDFLLFMLYGDEFEFEFENLTVGEYHALIYFILKVIRQEMEPLFTKSSVDDDEELPSLSESIFSVDISISEASNTSSYTIREQFIGDVVNDIIQFNKKAEKESKNQTDNDNVVKKSRRGTAEELDRLFM